MLVGKQELIDLHKREFDAWERILAGLSTWQITHPALPDSLSVKDTVAHLAAWQQRTIARLEAALHGHEPQFPHWPVALDEAESSDTVDHANAWILESQRNRPWTDVHQEWRTGFLHFLALLQEIPETDLRPDSKLAWLAEYQPLADHPDVYDYHHAEHRVLLESWLRSPTADGYLVLPPAGTGPGVLVLHAWWGLNETIKAFCSRLAEAGFVAFAPDLYGGKIAQTIAEAEALANALDSEQARADVAAATRYLLTKIGLDDRGLAVIGFSLGAFFALNLSNTAPEYIRTVVTFYGTGADDFRHAQATYLAHFAETDLYEPPENVDHLANALRQAGRPATFYTYPGTGHWFFEPDRTQAYNPAAASLAWERTLAFLWRSSRLQEGP
jgi:carboxymethylenebutenolidase